MHNRRSLLVGFTAGVLVSVVALLVSWGQAENKKEAKKPPRDAVRPERGREKDD